MESQSLCVNHTKRITDNEIMREVYANREALAARFDYDIHKICEHLREYRKELEKQGVKFATKEDVENRQ